MPHDPTRLSETRGWLQKAADDLRVAEHSLTADPPLLSACVFHCQQAAEKALKGFLTWHDQPFRKTHNLVEIGEQCVQLDGRLESLLRRAAPLTEYAWRFRYPGEPSEPSLDEATQALEMARRVYEAVVSRIPEEA